MELRSYRATCSGNENGIGNGKGNGSGHGDGCSYLVTKFTWAEAIIFFLSASDVRTQQYRMQQLPHSYPPSTQPSPWAIWLKCNLKSAKSGIDTLKRPLKWHKSMAANGALARRIFRSLSLTHSLAGWLSRSLLLEVSTCHSPILNLRYFWHFSKALHAKQTARINHDATFPCTAPPLHTHTHTHSRLTTLYSLCTRTPTYAVRTTWQTHQKC